MGIAVALTEARSASFPAYIGHAIGNARVVAERLTQQGYNIVTGGTDTHIVLVDLARSTNGARHLTGADAEARLGKIGITVNKNLVPGDTRPALEASGVRLGLQAMTTRGLDARGAVEVAELFHQALSDPMEAPALRRAVRRLCRSHPIP